MNYLFLLFLCFFQPLYGSKKPLMPLINVQVKGLLEWDNSLDNIPEQVIRFKGKETRNNPQGFFNFVIESEAPLIPMPSLLICKQSDPLFENKNTPTRITPLENKSYRYFFNEEGEWKEKSLDTSSVLSDNCIVILMDPARVENVVPWDVELENVVRTPLIQLPKIVLRKNVPAKKNIDVTFKSLSNSWDHGKLHELAPPAHHEITNQRGGKSLVTLPQ